MPNRRLARVKSSFSPKALNTWLGSGLTLVQADPLETATVFMLIIRSSPLTSGKAQLRLPGRRRKDSGLGTRGSGGRGSRRAGVAGREGEAPAEPWSDVG